MGVAGAGGSGLGEDRPAVGTGDRRRPGQVFAESDQQGGRGTLGGGAGGESRRGGRTGIGAGGTLRRERGPVGPGGAGHDSPAGALEFGPAVSSRGASSGPVPGIAGRLGGSRGSAGSVGPAAGLASGPVVRREPSAEPGGTGRTARGLVPGGSGQAAAVPDLHGAAAEPVLHGPGSGVGIAAHPAADGGAGGAESDASVFSNRRHRPAREALGPPRCSPAWSRVQNQTSPRPATSSGHHAARQRGAVFEPDLAPPRDLFGHHAARQRGAVFRTRPRLATRPLRPPRCSPAWSRVQNQTSPRPATSSATTLLASVEPCSEPDLAPPRDLFGHHAARQRGAMFKTRTPPRTITPLRHHAFVVYSPTVPTKPPNW